VPETHGYHNVAYCVYGNSALGIAGIHRQLWIADYKCRYAAGKKRFFIYPAHQACTHIFDKFSSQKGK